MGKVTLDIKLFQKCCQADEDESHQNEGQVDMGQPLIPDHQPAVVAQPGEGPFHFPPVSIPSQVSFPAGPRSMAPSLGNAGLNPSASQTVPQRATVVSFVRH
jgi:hypothetical protein